MRTKLLIAAVSLLIAAAAPGARAAGLPELLTQQSGDSFEVRPAVVGYTGDGTGLMGGHGRSVRHPGHIHWTRWSHRFAHGHGRAWINNCRPSCAEGHFHPVAATISAKRQRHGRFTHLAIHYRSGGADYRKLRHVPRDRFGPGFWIWAFANH